MGPATNSGSGKPPVLQECQLVLIPCIIMQLYCMKKKNLMIHHWETKSELGECMCLSEFPNSDTDI